MVVEQELGTLCWRLGPVGPVRPVRPPNLTASWLGAPALNTIPHYRLQTVQCTALQWRLQLSQLTSRSGRSDSPPGRQEWTESSSSQAARNTLRNQLLQLGAELQGFPGSRNFLDQRNPGRGRHRQTGRVSVRTVPVLL